MENVVLIVIIVFLVIYLEAQSSKKETARERYGEAVGKIANSAASTIAGIAHDITEPASQKEIRMARERLAFRNGQLYRFEDYSKKERVEELLNVGESFEKSLNLLGLSAERWQKIGKHIFYVGAIKYMSRDHIDYTKKNYDFSREHILKDWAKDPVFKDYRDTLREALSYFNIPEDEWIKYGDTVLDMYNINDKKDIEEFGIIVQLKPMENNWHLF